MFIYAAVCRENMEPATACAVADGLGIGPDAMIFDITNAHLGVLNGIVQIATAIEAGQIKAGMVVSCETSKRIMDITIESLNRNPDMENSQTDHSNPYRRLRGCCCHYAMSL